MEMLKKHTFKKVALATSVALALSATADVEQTEGFYLAPSIGYVTHSSTRQGADDDTSLGLAFGYQWASPWSAELAWQRANPDSTVGPGSVDAEQLRLDALYHFAQNDDVRWYWVFGAGQNSIENADEEMLNAGIGLKYALSDRVDLRSDLRSVYGFDSEATEAAFNLGLNILLGGGSKSPAKKPVESAPVDSDGDGVIDTSDRCPATPKGTAVDSQGCELDSDRDGVVNSKDKCPDSEAGSAVDENGCYRVLREDVNIALDVKFANNAADVLQSNRAQIAELANFMKQYPEVNVVIEGHTDSSGSQAYNQSLSQKRAEAVRQLLIDQYGIDATRLSARGYGEDRPIADNGTAEGRAANRRVQAVAKATIEKVIK